MLQNLQILKFFTIFASGFGSYSKFGHKKRAFSSLPKCQSLETFYNSRKSINDRCVSVFANLYGPPLAVYTRYTAWGIISRLSLNGFPEPGTW